MNYIEELLTNIPRTSFIEGVFKPFNQSNTFASYDPASGRVLVELTSANAEDVEEAAESAHRALQGSWRKMLPAERARILMRTAAELRRQADRIAQIESLDSGKPLREARGDVETSARYFEYYAGIADKLQGETIPLGSNFMSFTLHEALGVTAHIIPWNFPLVTTARGLAPALAAGCTAIIKPAEETPISALLLAQIMKDAGLPDGVYNVVVGNGEDVGAALVAHPLVAHVTFTGSVATGKLVAKSAADHVASTTLELGGKSPVVVLADADLDSAVEGVLKAIFTNSGQVCSAGSRLIVEHAMQDPLMDRLTAAVASMKAGRGIDDPAIGPIISPQQLSRISSYVDNARRRGLSIASGGKVLEVKDLEGGWFYAPTILEGASVCDPIIQEEIFGPVLAVQVADSPEHAIKQANGTPFGLVAGIYTADVTRALRFARDVEVGQVFINQYFAGGVETPFGGVKNSGYGREKGLEAVRNYLRIKTVTARI